ncbi:uncharacterized protein LOC109815897 [Cajanus cajan]|uniref:uncharacterized protein LOC109815897 n=1 Tax=Cajanus cajan TaxID=3821 RepID=UPI00098DC62C|nr:uncharacterized protein LOC109815897 [Cajanus cajan]
MMKKKGGSCWRKYNRTSRDKAQPLCYKCKKPRHYKTECPELEKEKEKEKKKSTLYEKKKAMMATWEDLDTTSSEDDEQANICLMVDTDSSSKSSDEEVSKYDFKDLQHAYNQLLINLVKISTAYREQKKRISEMLEENELLKSDLSKFTLGTTNLENLLKYSRSKNDKFGLAYVDSELENKPSTSAYPTYGKYGHFTPKCSHMHKKGYSKISNANIYGPKSIWVPKTEIIHVVDLFNKKRKCPVIVLRQWLLATHDGRKVYVLDLRSKKGGLVTFGGG